MEWTLFVIIIPVLFAYSTMEFKLRSELGVELKNSNMQPPPNFEPKDDRADIAWREPVDLPPAKPVKFNPSHAEKQATLGLLAEVGK